MEWKPEKNISSPWDVDTWENNIGQPVKPSGDNLPYPYTPSYIYNGEWYIVDTTKITTIKDVELLFSALGMKVGTENENFDKVKHLLIIPDKPKTLKQISQEFNDKIDELIENTKNKFYQSKYISEKLYDTKFDRIIQDFEYAKEHGSFPQKLTFTIGDGLSANNWTSNFVIKSNSMGVGYWDVKPNIQIWLQVKPNWLVRKCAKIFFDFGWKDG